MRLEDNRPADELARRVELVSALQHMWTYSTTTRSNLAREYGDTIAEAASRGFITTEVVPGGGLFGRLWKITPTGLQFLWAHAHLIEDTEENDYVQRHTVPEQLAGALEGSRGKADCSD
jgi:hypothetical protein